MSNDHNADAKILAEEHWKYVESVIRSELRNNENRVLCLSLDDYCGRVGHHFKTALIHGMKHGVEWAYGRKL